jgi:hypothetical protein
MNWEQLRNQEAKFAAMADGVAAGKVTPARLMSPVELAAAIRDRPDLRGKLSGWYLCTEVPEGMWERALAGYAKEAMPNHLVVIEQPASGRRYLAVVMQVDTWQHRVCVPLVGSAAGEWLRSLQSGAPLQLSVASASSDRAFVSTSDVPAGAIEQFRDTDTALRGDWREFLVESINFAQWNATVAQIDRRPGQPVPTEVSLSMLFSGEVQAELERLEDALAGRQPN